MPYELEYKKVHNTLSKKGLNNVYGYLDGQMINPVTRQTIEVSGSTYQNACKIEITKHRRQFVIQNNDSQNREATFYIYDTSSSNLLFYKGNATTSADISQTLWINAHSSQIISIPTNDAVLQTNANDEKTPSFLVVSLGNSITNWVMWETKDNILGKEENNKIISAITITDQSVTFFNLEDIDWTDANNFIENCSIKITWSNNSTKCRVEFYEHAEHLCPVWLRTSSLYKIVIVPMRYRKGKGHILKSITNTRNKKQKSLYADGNVNKYQTISLYLEPIILSRTSKTDEESQTTYYYWYKEFTFSNTLPMSSNLFTQTISKRGYTTYGLKQNFSARALQVCRGCGYYSGVDGGVTRICFAIGIQKVKNDSPHSGCSLKKYRFFDQDQSNDVITLTRIALSRTDNTDCIISL